MSLDFILKQKAKSKGGDKFLCVSDPSFSIYVPQTLSRVGDKVHQKLKINITPAAPEVVKSPVTTQIDEEE